MTPAHLAVTETAPFPATTLRRLRRTLLQERRAQLERAASLVDHDEADVALTVEWELAPVLVAQARHTIDEIDEAVARMDAGTYGSCETCGEHLPITRLVAIPHARSCVACQTATDPAEWRRGG